MPPFTEVWLALAGSSIPLRGEPRATVARAYPFLRRFRRLAGTTVERRGVMVVPGRASIRNAFLSVHDAARVMAALVDVPEVSGPVDVGGPEVLTWTDVAGIFGEVLGRPVRVRTTPVAVFTAGQRALARVAPSASAVLGLNRLIGTAETPWDTSELTRRLGVHPLRTVEQVIREKAALPAD
jgi:nucleoside-diphosphate-sugar epimerase